MAIVRISKKFSFEASHILPKHPGKCSRLHGHSWKGEIVVEGDIDRESGFIVDYTDLKKLLEEHIVSNLDHTHLGQYSARTYTGRDKDYDAWIPFMGLQFYPSSENLVVAIGKILQPLVKELAPNVKLFEVSLEETCTSKAIWRPKDV